MRLTDNFVRLPLAQITVNREARQRRRIFDDSGKFINSDGLLETIAKHGVIQPILVDKDLRLIFGERRYTASAINGLPDIPARFAEDLSPSEYEVLELIENLNRKALEWRDEVSAIAKFHHLQKESEATWSLDDTAKAIGRGIGTISNVLRIWRDFANPRIADATSMQQAFNTLARLDDRAEAETLGALVDATSELFDDPPPDSPAPVTGNGADGLAAANGGAFSEPTMGDSGTLMEGHSPPAVFVPPTPPPESILNASFLEWAPQYTGKPFNMIHCDFPYGVGLFGGAWGGKNTWNAYEDRPDDYTTLIRSLCANLDRVLAPSGHLLFWTSASIRIQWETIELFRELAPSLIFNEMPLIWHKTDNVGIVPDPRREARRVYETCLYAARSDRLVVKPISNAYGSPTNKDLHPSTKPEPMLRHFFQMFVDENTRLLDPTCGSGSALRAAESLGAVQVLGLEVSKEYADNARTALKNFRNLRKASK